MKARTALARLIEFAQINDVEKITSNLAILSDLKAFLGNSNASTISYSELARFQRRAGITKTKIDWDSGYARRDRPVPWKLTKPVLSLVRLLEQISCPQRALDLGCGDGTHAVYMAKKGAAVTGVDVSSQALILARSRVRRAGVRCSLIKKDIFDLNLRPGHYDLIFDRGCFHHVPVFWFDEYKEIVFRALRPGGRLLLICHNYILSEMNTDDLCADIHLGPLAKILRYICDGFSESSFTPDEITRIFSPKFSDLRFSTAPDVQGRPHRFLECLMVKPS